MADFSIWDRKTLERFAYDATNKLIRAGISVGPECFNKWEHVRQVERDCNRCPLTLECKKLRENDA